MSRIIKNKSIYIAIFVFFTTITISMAQPGGPGGAPGGGAVVVGGGAGSPVGSPVDGGALALLIIGVAILIAQRMNLFDKFHLRQND